MASWVGGGAAVDGEVGEYGGAQAVAAHHLDAVAAFSAAAKLGVELVAAGVEGGHLAVHAGDEHLGLLEAAGEASGDPGGASDRQVAGDGGELDAVFLEQDHDDLLLAQGHGAHAEAVVVAAAQDLVEDAGELVHEVGGGAVAAHDHHRGDGGGEAEVAGGEVDGGGVGGVATAGRGQGFGGGAQRFREGRGSAFGLVGEAAGLGQHLVAQGLALGVGARAEVAIALGGGAGGGEQAGGGGGARGLAAARAQAEGQAQDEERGETGAHGAGAQGREEGMHADTLRRPADVLHCAAMPSTLQAFLDDAGHVVVTTSVGPVGADAGPRLVTELDLLGGDIQHGRDVVFTRPGMATVVRMHAEAEALSDAVRRGWVERMRAFTRLAGHLDALPPEEPPP